GARRAGRGRRRDVAAAGPYHPRRRPAARAHPGGRDPGVEQYRDGEVRRPAGAGGRVRDAAGFRLRGADGDRVPRRSARPAAPAGRVERVQRRESRHGVRVRRDSAPGGRGLRGTRQRRGAARTHSGARGPGTRGPARVPPPSRTGAPRRDARGGGRAPGDAAGRGGAGDGRRRGAAQLSPGGEDRDRAAGGARTLRARALHRFVRRAVPRRPPPARRGREDRGSAIFRPQLVVVVKIADPRRGGYFAAQTAAPVTRAMLEQALAARTVALDRARLAPEGAPRAATIAAADG